LSSAQQKHSQAQTYVPCYLQLKLFGKQQKVYLLLDAQCRNIIKHNEQVKKKRLILCQFIDAVNTLANQKFLFWGHDEPSTSLNAENFVEFVSVLKNRLNSDTVFYFRIQISYILHEICFSIYHITQQTSIKYGYLLFIYLFTYLLSSVYNNSVEE
jgi:hypothetical protein